MEKVKSQDQSKKEANSKPAEQPQKLKFEPEECYSTAVLGLTGVGKTHKNVEMCKLYVRNIPGYKTGKKVLILNFQNEDGYAPFKKLKPTADEIKRFVSQKTVEIRQITPIDIDGSAMNNARKVEVMKLVLQNYRNGLAVFDDIDGYAAFASSSDKDLIGSLMGLRHRGCHTIFAHQAWRKMGVTECENVRFIRLHKSLDSPESMSADKKNNFDMNLLMIAHYAVEAQYDLANRLYEQGKINKQQWLAGKSYSVYIDRWKRKIHPISEKNFQIAVRRYLFNYPRVIDKEIQEMAFDGEHVGNKKDPATREKAIQRLTERFKNTYLNK